MLKEQITIIKKIVLKEQITIIKNYILVLQIRKTNGHVYLIDAMKKKANTFPACFKIPTWTIVHASWITAAIDRIFAQN